MAHSGVSDSPGCSYVTETNAELFIERGDHLMVERVELFWSVQRVDPRRPLGSKLDQRLYHQLHPAADSQARLLTRKHSPDIPHLHSYRRPFQKLDSS